MAISAGTRVGPYEVTAVIGAGGMGEVYRARDTKLHREVALKVLPDLVAADSDRLARFEREAHVLASLNHPNIGAIHGFEESNGIRALVLELVEGETLADRIARGPIPLDDALAIARQITDALEAAHEDSIIHRDLKPANIKVRDDGTVKVLDFGLAKALESIDAAPDGSLSPTLTVAATRAGVILGTAAYMAPEQARGKAVDKRGDIWAFGCVLYEMLTGRRAFAGEGISETLASVLTREPDWTVLPPAPAAINRVLQRCLEKSPRDRLHDIGDARVEIDEALATPSRDESGVSATRPAASRWRGRRLLPWAVAVGSLAVTTILVLMWQPWRSMPSTRVSRFAIVLPRTTAPTISGIDSDVAITPDGSRVVYVGSNGAQLFVRPLDALEPVSIAKGDSTRGPFVSPDGQWVGFLDNTSLSLKKVAITGGPAITIARFDAGTRGATWTPDDSIILATTNSTTGLLRVSAAGGPLEHRSV